MKEFATPAARRLSDAFSNIPDTWKTRLSRTRHLARPDDPMRRMLDGTTLRECVARFLSTTPLPQEPLILFMDRHGGSESAHVSSSLIEMLGQRGRCVFVHTAFATSPAGIGTLLRASLTRKGADCGVLVDVVAVHPAAEGYGGSTAQAAELCAAFDLVITLAPSGTAGCLALNAAAPDPLLAVSHINVLSFSDPEHLVADLAVYEEIVAKRTDFHHIRFVVEVKDEGAFVPAGDCLLGEGGNAREQLWKLLDEARRYPYRVLIEPVARGAVAGDPLRCPCRTLLEKGEGLPLQVDRVLPGGGDLLVTGRGLAARGERS